VGEIASGDEEVAPGLARAVARPKACVGLDPRTVQRCDRLLGIAPGERLGLIHGKTKSRFADTAATVDLQTAHQDTACRKDKDRRFDQPAGIVTYRNNAIVVGVHAGDAATGAHDTQLPFDMALAGFGKSDSRQAGRQSRNLEDRQAKLIGRGDDDLVMPFVAKHGRQQHHLRVIR
jgi:hypothetical protein